MRQSGPDERQRLRLLSQCPRRELNQRQHRPAHGSEIPHEPRAAHLRLGEPDRCGELIVEAIKTLLLPYDEVRSLGAHKQSAVDRLNAFGKSTKSGIVGRSR